MTQDQHYNAGTLFGYTRAIFRSERDRLEARRSPN